MSPVAPLGSIDRGVHYNGDHGDHGDTVRSVALSQREIARSGLAASWRRSLVHHRLDPDAARTDDRLTAAELRARRDGLGAILRTASPLLDRLYAAVCDAGCAVLLTDADGVVADQRVDAGSETAFDAAGLALGADWSEAAQGTNGIGTCIVEKRPLTIHRDQHFRTRNTVMSCIDAPIFRPDGRLAAVLDVSACRNDVSSAVARIIAISVNDTAWQIEAALFRAAYPEARIVIGDRQPSQGTVLLAVDADDLVVGATRTARRAFDIGDAELKARIPAGDVLSGLGQADLSGALRGEIQRALSRARGNAAAAARDLGIGRATLYRHMNRLGISQNQYRSAQRLKGETGRRRRPSRVN